jgi:hypothetical protein
MFQDSHVGKKQVADTIMLFVKEKYLYWLEALSLCKNATKCVAAMEALSSLADVRDTQIIGYCCYQQKTNKCRRH